MNEFVEISRAITKWEWYKTPNMFHLYTHLLMNAEKDASGVTSISTSIRKLSAETGISERCVRTCIKNLELTHYVTHKATHKNTVITICDSELYRIIFDTSDTVNDTVNDTLKEKEKEKDKRNLPPVPPKEKEKEKEKESESLSLRERAREKNFFNEYFSLGREMFRDAFVMALHRENEKASHTLLLEMAKETFSEFERQDKTHSCYSDFANHLENVIRRKNRAYKTIIATKSNPFDEYERKLKNGDFNIQLPDTLPF